MKKNVVVSCGNVGPKVRSDCRVELQILDSGGIKINLTSKVKALYVKMILLILQKMCLITLKLKTVS